MICKGVTVARSGVQNFRKPVAKVALFHPFAVWLVMIKEAKVLNNPHAAPEEKLLNDLGTNREKGLSPGEAARRLKEYGPNTLEEPPGKSIGIRLLEQLKDPMILVLLAAAVLSVISSGGTDFLDAAIILLIVVINAVISIVQETGAEKSLAALQQMAAPQASVIRDGVLSRVETALLVPGDLIRLEAGDYVPADARILSAAGVKADESSLTGESVPVDKFPGVLKGDTPLGDRSNMVLASTVISGGRALAVVTGTGMETEVGHIASMLLRQEEGETPLQRKMAEISKSLSAICLGVCAIMFGVGLLQGKDLLSMLMEAVSLAVAAIPEGLPAIVTIVLAMGVSQMAKKNAIVRRLSAVETLGCASVICSDKTGTLTRNQMTVETMWTASPKARPFGLTVGCLCNDVVVQPDGTLSGDPTETALVAAAKAENMDKRELEKQYPLLGELPFDSDRKCMSTIHSGKQGGVQILVKGAPDVLLSRCTSVLSDRVVPLDEGWKKRILQENERMAAKALRVLALAYRDAEKMPETLDSASVENHLTFVALVGMIDPPREEAKQAVADCKRAGIRTIMITGDHKVTAAAIARDLGILEEGGTALTGSDLDFLPEGMLEETVKNCNVYARVSPEHKLKLVKALQADGSVVAMTGDGVNDAPALKAADIGCAMGKSGTDVAKGAADMILTDDNFATIVEAVKQGRGIYDDIRKSIHYLLSCNIGEIITIFVATVLNFHQMPLIPVQLLWLNLVTDSFPALALGVERVEETTMDRPPRKANEKLIAGDFAFKLLWQGVLMGLVTLCAYFLGEYVLSDPGTADQSANTMAFITLVMCQLFHAFDVRSDTQSIFKIGLLSNPAMNRAFVLCVALQLAAVLAPPLRSVFSVVALSATEWVAVILLSILPTVVCELVKMWKNISREKANMN